MIPVAAPSVQPRPRRRVQQTRFPELAMSTNPDSSDWVGRGLREALSSALDVRLRGPNSHATEEALQRACRALAARAVELGCDPGQLVRAFRDVWDGRVTQAHGDDPRSLLYYGTLSQCLDAYECAHAARPR
jgi:hypothetical protein